jgi:hypothetical protein
MTSCEDDMILDCQEREDLNDFISFAISVFIAAVVLVVFVCCVCPLSCLSYYFKRKHDIENPEAAHRLPDQLLFPKKSISKLLCFDKYDDPEAQNAIQYSYSQHSSRMSEGEDLISDDLDSAATSESNFDGSDSDCDSLESVSLDSVGGDDDSGAAVSAIFAESVVTGPVIVAKPDTTQSKVSSHTRQASGGQGMKKEERPQSVSSRIGNVEEERGQSQNGSFKIRKERDSQSQNGSFKIRKERDSQSQNGSFKIRKERDSQSQNGSFKIKKERESQSRNGSFKIRKERESQCESSAIEKPAAAIPTTETIPNSAPKRRSSIEVETVTSAESSC